MLVAIGVVPALRPSPPTSRSRLTAPSPSIRKRAFASNPKVFGAAGRAPYSPIGSAFDGRRAAVSIDRLLQGASLTASRTDEAGGGACLYVNVEAHAPVPPVAPAEPQRGYSRDEAIAEASRCFPCHCLECVKACEYLKHYGSYPKRYVRDIYNNLSIVLGNRKANRMIDSCTLCGLCGTLCPNDLSMGEVCLEARRDMVDSGHMPASHHEFALRDMAHSRSEAAAFARSQPGLEKCAVAFFPGCQLAASSPWHVERVYAHLAEKIPGGVGLIVDCCGAPALWSGRRALHDEVTATPARDLAKPRRAGDRHRVLDLPQDARRIPARNEGALAVDGDRRDRLAGRGKAAGRRAARPSRSLHGAARIRRATRRARAR